ncbi:MAG: cysteine desulfurase NifS [Oscillospiraceae bacterium]|jgi:cysteine desulfurase|nr:cysteine desulfurase NifS [Oscillospiraceae bacterium]
MNAIYLDNAATTKVKPEVLAKMLPYFTDVFGNPGSVHAFGRSAKLAIDKAREQVAKAIGANASEITFTASGTEADNIALIGAAIRNQKKGKHIITSAIEHHAVLHTAEHLAKQGFDVTYLPVDADGIVSPETLESAIREDTTVVSVMAANNEIGTIQPIRELAEIARKHGALFHTDAVQAVGSIPINVHELGVDMLSLSAHKFHGPKGIGALYLKKGVRVDALEFGGSQERGLRPGTENVPYIVGLGEAAELATRGLQEKAERVARLRDKLIDGILERVPYSRLNGHRMRRLPNNSNISIRFVEGESLLLTLDMAGIAASSGSACTSGSLDPSHVLLAIGLTHEIAHGSLRLTLSDETTEEEIDRVLEVLPNIAQRLRKMSPLWEDFQFRDKNSDNSNDKNSGRKEQLCTLN